MPNNYLQIKNQPYATQNATQKTDFPVLQITEPDEDLQINFQQTTLINGTYVVETIGEVYHIEEGCCLEPEIYFGKRNDTKLTQKFQKLLYQTLQHKTYNTITPTLSYNYITRVQFYHGLCNDDFTPWSFWYPQTIAYTSTAIEAYNLHNICCNVNFLRQVMTRDMYYQELAAQLKSRVIENLAEAHEVIIAPANE